MLKFVMLYLRGNCFTIYCTGDIGNFVHLFYNNIVSYGVDRKPYIEISSEGVLAIFAVSKRKSIQMWNHSLFYSHRLVGGKVGHRF